MPREYSSVIGTPEIIDPSNACHHLAAECGVTQQEAWIAVQVDGMVSLQHVTYTREYNSVVNNIAKCDYS
jgi:hypothetical protein